MKWAVGVLTAPRPVSTLQETLSSLVMAGWNNPFVFAEPGVTETGIDRTVWRPDTIAPLRSSLKYSPVGQFGNFQNWIQAAHDLLVLDPEAECILMCEDDALFVEGLRKFAEPRMRPHPSCGVVSFYTPPMRAYRQRMGFVPTPRINARNGLVGALAMAFRRDILERMLQACPLTDRWAGPKSERYTAETVLWERKGIDTWIGARLAQMRMRGWHFLPSLVCHNVPDGEVNNSTLGHVHNRAPIQRAMWVGPQADLETIFPRRR